jgi:hypothetical protein
MLYSNVTDTALLNILLLTSVNSLPIPRKCSVRKLTKPNPVVQIYYQICSFISKYVYFNWHSIIKYLNTSVYRVLFQGSGEFKELTNPVLIVYIFVSSMLFEEIYVPSFLEISLLTVIYVKKGNLFLM